MNKYLSIIGLTYFFTACAVSPAADVPVAIAEHRLQNRLSGDNAQEAQQALLQALEARDYDAAEQALSRGARVTMAAQANALLAWAQQNLNVNLQKSLVRQGIANMRNADGTTLFTKAINDSDMVRYTLFCCEQGTDLDAPDADGHTPLLAALRNENCTLARRLLSRGAQVNSCDGCGVTPLHVAAFRSHKDLVKMLLKRGALVNVTSYNGKTPLVGAACNANLDVIKLLIAHGANYTTGLDEEGLTFFDYLQRREFLATAIAFIAERERLEHSHALFDNVKKLGNLMKQLVFF